MDLPRMTVLPLSPFTLVPTSAEAAADTVPSSIADRFDAVDERLLTMEERLDLILQRGKGLLDEIVKLGRKVDTVVAENRAAAEERAR